MSQPPDTAQPPAVSPPPKIATPRLGQKKEQHLKRIDEQIARLQEEKSCVQDALYDDDLKACRERFRQEMKEYRQKKR
jgi:hypothetical protein